MITDKQKKAVNEMVVNGGYVKRAMLKAGYSENTAKTPQKLTESKGFQELTEEYLPDDLLLGALNEDIKGKPKNRKPELELAFKIKGRMIERIDHTSKNERIYDAEQIRTIAGRTLSDGETKSAETLD